MQIPWYIPALGAALIWGVHYPLVDFAIKRVSLFSLLVLGVLPVLLLLPFYFHDVLDDVKMMKTLPFNEQSTILVISLTGFLGAVLLYMSISSKNATLASLVEITYPIFVVFFSYVLFKQLHINASVLFGGLMILIGAGLIIYNNP